jgi:phage protein D
MVDVSYSNVMSVKIGGQQLDKLPEIAALFTGGWVDQGAGVPAAFRLTFRDPRRRVLEKLNVDFGTPVVLSPVAAGQGAATPLLTGEVTGMETDYDGAGTFTVIRGYDPGHRLLRQRRVAAYRNQRASDIARKLAGQDGVPIGSIQATTTVYDFISQSNITDWDFLARLADENEMVMSLDSKGRFQFVRPDPASGAPPVSTPGEKAWNVLQGGHDIMRCRAAATAADQVTKVEARGWDVTAKKALTATATATSNRGITIGTTPAKTVAKFKSATLVETDTPYDTRSEVKNAADALADDVTSSFAEVEVTARGNPRLRPGVPVTLSRVGKPFEGKYTVTSARHVFNDSEPYHTLLTVSGRQWRSLYGLTSGGGTVTAPRLPGVVPALVTDVNDPLKQGRVRVKFPWLDDKYVSDWTRTVQLGGTAGGGVFPFDVGDEVLVSFDRGTLDHAYVIGGLYNGKDKPTPVNDVPLIDGVRKKAVRHTLSDREGNRVDLLSQQTGRRKRGVRIASGDNQLVINLDRTNTEITITSKGDIKITGNRSVSVEAKGDLTLKGRRRVEITSYGPLELNSRGPLNLNGDGLVSLKSLGLFSVNSVGALNLSAEGAASLTGVGTVQINSVANVDIKGLKVTANEIPVV